MAASAPTQNCSVYRRRYKRAAWAALSHRGRAFELAAALENHPARRAGPLSNAAAAGEHVKTINSANAACCAPDTPPGSVNPAALATIPAKAAPSATA